MIASGGTRRHSELPKEQGQNIQKEVFKKIGKVYIITATLFCSLVFSINFYRENDLVKAIELSVTDSVWGVQSRYLDLSVINVSSSHDYILCIFFSFIFAPFLMYFTIRDLFYFQLINHVYDPIVESQKIVPAICISCSVLLIYFWYIMDLNLGSTNYYGLKVMFMSPVYVILTPIYLIFIVFLFSGLVVWILKMALQKWKFAEA